MSPHYWIGPISKGGDSYPTYLPTYLLLFFALPCTYSLNFVVYRAVRVDGSTERERERERESPTHNFESDNNTRRV